MCLTSPTAYANNDNDDNNNNNNDNDNNNNKNKTTNNDDNDDGVDDDADDGGDDDEDDYDDHYDDNDYHDIISLYFWRVVSMSASHYSDVRARWRLKSPASRLFTQPFVRRGSKKTSKLRITGLCEGNSPVTGEFPSQRASNAENASAWWRRHGNMCVYDNGLLSDWVGCRSSSNFTMLASL